MLRRPLSTHQREPDLVASPATRRRGTASTPTTASTASTAPAATSTAPAATSAPTTAVPATGRTGSTPGTAPAGGARLAAGLRPRLDAGASRQLIAARSASGATIPIILARPPRRDIHRHGILLTPVAGGARAVRGPGPTRLDGTEFRRTLAPIRARPSRGNIHGHRLVTAPRTRGSRALGRTRATSVDCSGIIGALASAVRARAPGRHIHRHRVAPGPRIGAARRLGGPSPARLDRADLGAPRPCTRNPSPQGGLTAGDGLAIECPTQRGRGLRLRKAPGRHVHRIHRTAEGVTAIPEIRVRDRGAPEPIRIVRLVAVVRTIDPRPVAVWVAAP